jgi:hypothetical protein
MESRVSLFRSSESSIMSQPGQNSPSLNAPAPKKSNSMLWIIGIILAVLAGGGCLCCGGMAVMTRVGLSAAGQAVGVAAARDPAVQEHIGTVETCAMNISKTAEHGQRKPEHAAFDIKGSKGSGTLLVKIDNGQNGEVRITSGELILPSGETIPLNAGGK